MKSSNTGSRDIEKVKALIEPVLKEADNDEKKKAVEDFWNKWCLDFYFNMVLRVYAGVADGTITPEDAFREIKKYTDELLEVADRLDGTLKDAVLLNRVKNAFRQLCAPYAINSDIVKHAYMKPSGYAGDYGIIEMAYDNVTLSQGFGQAVDLVFQFDDYAFALRGRKGSMKSLLQKYLYEMKQRPMEILNVACGSCRELKDMISEGRLDDTGKVVFTLMDQDQQALDFSKNALRFSPPNFEYSYLRCSVYDFLKQPEKYRAEIGQKDIVYSIGLADYIPYKSLQELIAFFYSLLKPGGRLIVAHKDSKIYKPLTADWLCDWSFHLRSEPELVDLVNTCGIKDYMLKVEKFPWNKIIFFLIIERK
jgi:SAM-dependent methyltransferase